VLVSFKSKVRAQAVIETLIILAIAVFILTFLVTMVYAQFDSYNRQVQERQASLAVSTLAKEIDDAYFLGPGTVKNVVIILPTDVDLDNSFILGKAVVLRVGESDITASTSVTVRGSWPNSSGSYVFSITSFGDFVYVSQQDIMFSPARISQSVAQTFYKDLTIVATNSSQTSKSYDIELDFPSDGSSEASASISASSPITFAASSSTNIPLRVSCARDSFGSYVGSIIFNPTDGSDNNLSVPINLVCVSSQPKLKIFPSTLSIEYTAGSNYTNSLLACNLTSSAISSPSVTVTGGIVPYVFASQISSIPANSCSTINLAIFVPSGMSTFSGKVNISAQGLSSSSDVNVWHDIGGTINSGLAGLWKFNGDATDSSSNANNASWSGSGASYTTGLVEAQSANFNGSNYAVISDSSALNPSQLTVSFWMNLHSISSNWGGVQMLSKKATNWADRGAWVFMYYNGEMISGVYSSDCTSVTKYVAADPAVWPDATPISTNTWYLMTLTVSSSTATFYINDQVKNTIPYSYGLCQVRTDPIWVGHDSGNDWFDGQIEGVTIWDRALSADEVTYLYNGGVGRSLSP